MTDEESIYTRDKMKQKTVYPTEQTPSYADWALYEMGKELEAKVDSIGGVPEHTSEDAGKVLKVTAENRLAWATDEQGHAQVQSNWDESDNTQPSYIQNKPTIPEGVPAYTTSDDGKVLGVTVDSSGETPVAEVEWVEPEGGLPEFTTADDGKVLGVTVDSSGETPVAEVNWKELLKDSELVEYNNNVVTVIAPAIKYGERKSVYINSNTIVEEGYLYIGFIMNTNEYLQTEGSRNKVTVNGSNKARFEVYTLNSRNMDLSYFYGIMYIVKVKVKSGISDLYNCLSVIIPYDTKFYQNIIKKYFSNTGASNPSSSDEYGISKVFVNTTTQDAFINTAAGVWKKINNENSSVILTDTSDPTTATVGVIGQIFINTSTQNAFMCTAVDTVTPSYTWKQITLT